MGIMLICATLLSTVALQRYTGIFSETFKLLNTIIVLPVRTASAECLSATYEAHQDPVSLTKTSVGSRELPLRVLNFRL